MTATLGVRLRHEPAGLAVPVGQGHQHAGGPPLDVLAFLHCGRLAGWVMPSPRRSTV